MILSHEVQNFSDWKQFFDQDAPLREQLGVNVTGVYTAVDNPNHVTVISEIASAEVIQSLMTNPALQETMQKAGVVGQPEIKILNPVI